MKKLLIVRHAKSSWDYPNLSDLDRPLNGRGKKNAPDMGRRLAKRRIFPDKMISSPAKRAFGTAKRIARVLGYVLENIKVEKDLYHGTLDDIKKVVMSVGNDVNTLMIFGHNPDFTTLTNELSGSDIYNIPTCGIAEIDFDIESWEDLNKKCGVLRSFDYPKKLISN